ncbi:MAG: hypothetical protein U0U70_13225 [Chitinophagaceae bacterium]
MKHTQDIELIVSSLNKERNDLLLKVAEIDKVIKRIKYGGLNLGLNKPIIDEAALSEANETQDLQAFPVKAELKVQAIKIMDILGVASKLGEIRGKYHEITGLNVNFRETLRNLNRHEILKILQPKGNIRGLYWVKTEWLDDKGNLKEKHKFHGFELLFTDDMIEFK